MGKNAHEPNNLSSLPGTSPRTPAEAPAELPREWRFEHKVVEFDDMFGGSRQIELRTKR